MLNFTFFPSVTKVKYLRAINMDSVKNLAVFTCSTYYVFGANCHKLYSRTHVHICKWSNTLGQDHSDTPLTNFSEEFVDSLGSVLLS